MPDEANQNEFGKARDFGASPPKKAAPAWRRFRVGWVILALLVLSWLAFLLLVKGAGFLLFH